MAGFIIGEIIILNQPVEPTVIEVFYFGLGLLISLIALTLHQKENQLSNAK